ncbi:tetratricopeptide repeat protein [Corallincola platygyrae]|uniref:Tetratricopeptide repeat protein n=1 Tax=Corallincola platygyrae TaxID=1193278 RepID=A0ABW4XR69_9GAMM
MNSALKIFSRAVTAIICLFLMGGCVSHTQRVVEEKPLDKQIYETLEKADGYYKQGRLAEAETEYLKITQQYPKYSYAWYRLGNIYVRTGHMDAGVRSYEQAIKADPENSRAWYNLSLTRVKQAIAVSDDGLSIIPITDNDRKRLEILQSRLLEIIK